MSRVRGDGRADHERDGDHLRRGDLGSGQARRHASARRSSSRSRCSRRSSRRWRSTSPPTSCRRPTTSPTRSRGSINFKTGGLITGILGIADAAVEAARRSVRLHLHVAARLLGRARIDRRRADRRLLDRAAARAARSRICICRTACYRGWNWRGDRRDRSSAARWRGAASSFRRCGRSTTTPGSSGFAAAFGVYIAMMPRRGRRHTNLGLRSGTRDHEKTNPKSSRPSRTSRAFL